MPDPWEEAAFYFENEGARLFGMLYAPRDTSQRRECGLVFCAPFAEEAAISQRVCVDFARELANRGYPVLRFDYRGCGDSEGRFEGATLTTHRSDIRRAVEELRMRSGLRVGLFGLRLGAMLAAEVAASRRMAGPLILWEPTVQLNEYVARFIRMRVVATNGAAGRVVETRRGLMRRLDRGETIDIIGYPLSPRCYREFLETSVPKRLAGFSGSALVVTIGRENRVRRETNSMVETLRGSGGTVEAVNVHEPLFWIDPGNPWREFDSWHGHERLFQSSTDWLDRVTV